MSIQAMKQALEALEDPCSDILAIRRRKQSITVLRAAIEAAEKQEPVAVFDGFYESLPMFSKFPDELDIGTNLYTHPQPTIPAGMVGLFEKAIHHLKQHAAEYKHPGQHKLISDMENMLDIELFRRRAQA